MKKYNEGYVMPMVMVVLIALCAVSLSVLSPALNNLQSQKTSISRTQERYNLIRCAEIVIDDFCSQFPYEGSVSNTFSSMGDQGILDSLTESAKVSIKEHLLNLDVAPTEKEGDWVYNGSYVSISSDKQNFILQIDFDITYSFEYIDKTPDNSTDPIFTVDNPTQDSKTCTLYYSIKIEEFEASTTITSKGGNGE